MSGSVKVVDRGYNALLGRLVRGAGKVTVGIHEQEGAAPEGDSGITVAEVAALHEFGLGGQEQRSFVRAYVDQRDAQIQGSMRQIGEGIVSGKIPSVEQGLEQLGAEAASGMQDFITSGSVQPEIKPATIARKGHATPLLNKGTLVGSITSKVTK